ncbi:MAG: phosphatase PAP2 family protein [Deltaproteobacteria bacterium]|jgi:acid phosphatase (class A)|nr:phosphatase PAP2 family protein [Deltaproteobacteria bacterium]
MIPFKKVFLLVLSLGLLLSSSLAQADEPGYLPKGSQPDPTVFLDPPPEFDSVLFAEDLRLHYLTKPLKGGPRWRRATRDAVYQNKLPEYLSDILGVNLTPKNAPKTFKLLNRAAVDLGTANSTIKDRYQRLRPYAFFNLPKGSSCDPREEFLERDHSYPSGHSAVGYGQALIFAGMFPDKQNEFILAGREYGHSRVICGVHWKSDVEAGQVVSGAVITRLYGQPEFQKDLAAAKDELTALVAAKKKKP